MFSYPPLRKAFKKEIKIIENQGGKQIKTIEDHLKQLAKSNVFFEKDCGNNKYNRNIIRKY